MVQQKGPGAGSGAAGGLNEALAAATSAISRAKAVTSSMPRTAGDAAAPPTADKQSPANGMGASHRAVDGILADLSIGGKHPAPGSPANGAAAVAADGAKQRSSRKPKSARWRGGGGGGRRRGDPETSDEEEDETGLGSVANEAATMCREALQRLQREALWDGAALTSLNQAFAGIVQASPPLVLTTGSCRLAFVIRTL